MNNKLNRLEMEFIRNNKDKINIELIDRFQNSLKEYIKKGKLLERKNKLNKLNSL